MRIIMSDEKAVEVEVEQWDVNAHSFIIEEGSNPQLDEIYKKQKILGILVLKREDGSFKSLRNVRLKSRINFSTTSEAQSAFGKMTSLSTQFVWEEVHLYSHRGI
jgi:hypothetical protein